VIAAYCDALRQGSVLADPQQLVQTDRVVLGERRRGGDGARKLASTQRPQLAPVEEDAGHGAAEQLGLNRGAMELS